MKVKRVLVILGMEVVVPGGEGRCPLLPVTMRKPKLLISR